MKLRRHRRYAGDDGLLPRNCYSSVSKDAAGDDGGTLTRELLAYVDRRIPGTVFVGDSTDERLNALLSNSVKVVPGYCATYVLLFEPQDPDEKTTFHKVYRELLAEERGAPDQPIHAFAFETRVDECTIENVIDLRWPNVQQWFFDQFKDGDGVFLTKKGGTVREFYDLLPTAASRAARYSRTAHDASSAGGRAMGSSPGTRFFLPASALIRLASIEKPSPPTKPVAMHFATTPSNTRRNASLWRKRSCRARLNTEWSGIPSSMPSLQNHRYARLTCTSEHNRRSERIANT